jgi:hypothetical protein
MPSRKSQDEIKKISTDLKLNGCSECGALLNSRYLHFHHIKKNERKFAIHGMELLNRTDCEIIEEIHKCVLLCNKCHGKYTAIDKS